ncbi:MAG: cyclopropane-fatty-acyl-phospholipid synthase family protein [Pseudohongiellaceae bacterium]|nr:cyclopropane-fatty-acyl-phospholipid synthase family protein [Pseudohongiellaceae bacterium]
MKTMTLKANTVNRSSGRTHTASIVDKWAKKFVMDVLKKLNRQRVVLEDGDRRYYFGEDESSAELTAHIKVLSPHFYTDLLKGGSIACGESYMWGHWTTNDLLTLVRVMVLNLHVLNSVNEQRSFLTRWATSLLHKKNNNNRTGSRRNIAAHYDLSNEFFATFLDPTMMYSAAIFPSDDCELEEASVNKLVHTCERLQLKADDHLLEIGSGWGSLAIHAAKEYGCKVTTATLSKEQYEFASARIKAEGLEDKVNIVLRDYRDLEGQYDKLVSIEMIEAVGHEFYCEYFAQCSRLLKEDGLMLIQAITISDQRYHQAKKSVDFIQRYIFPGGCLPSNSAIAEHIAKDTDMQIVGVEDITRDYSLTLGHWRKAFLDERDAVESLGFSEEFIRMWDYYLAYCQGGFAERVIHTAQFLCAKPMFRSTAKIGLPQ